jgi:hypothetical protein
MVGAGFRDLVLCTQVGAGDAIATKEKEDVGGVGVRIGLMDKELNERASWLLFLPYSSVCKGVNLFGAGDHRFQK